MSLNGNRPTYVSVAVAAGTTGFSCGVTFSAEEEEAPLNQEYTDAPTDQQSLGAAPKPSPPARARVPVLARHPDCGHLAAPSSVISPTRYVALATPSSPLDWVLRAVGPVTSHSTWSVGLLVKVLKLLAGADPHYDPNAEMGKAGITLDRS